MGMFCCEFDCIYLHFVIYKHKFFYLRKRLLVIVVIPVEDYKKIESRYILRLNRGKKLLLGVKWYKP
ncbi:hypothetical protein L6452_21576 [Arctium lappa]|uniref:Uncharacterized protein n=1 Tax=Arctium lappa TaxID=4217 RepID=A0ACB9AZ23_ARCLA|nr:hypothetical protein L6452_21576 [Arctium lappa]